MSGSLTVTLSAEVPPDWDAVVARCGGGFFHSPPGLEAGAPRGTAMYLRASRGPVIVAAAAGVRTRCRLALRAEHWYFPTLPAAVTDEGGGAALGAVAVEGRRAGAAEIVFDSFDAPWQPGPDHPPPRHAPRQEYVLETTADPAALLARFADTHRRHARRGEKDGWRMSAESGPGAAQSLASVQEGATERAASRGRGFVAHALRLAGKPAADLTAPWGAATFTARQGDTLLAAVLVGWAAGRAYYIAGGSSPDGYKRSASVWLQWRVMAELAARGRTLYNFGGAPAASADPSDASHGLHRFKTGFGATVVPARGAHWRLKPGHLRLHGMVAKLRGARA